MNLERISRFLKYTSETGDFHWIENKGRSRAGTLAGAKHNCGYVCIGIDGKLYLAHRLAIVLSGFSLSKNQQVDHINGDRADNRLENLRVASHAENCQNTKARAHNKSGMKGVGYEPKRKMWRARVSINKKTVWLGYFNSPEKAHAAYCAAAKKLHGEFFRT